MTRKKQVNVKSYRRKDGTVVRSSNRSVMTFGDKNVNKRQNTLGGHIRKGATILGALGGATLLGANNAFAGGIGGAGTY